MALEVEDDVMKLSAIGYYLRSIGTLLTRFENPGQILRIFLGQQPMPTEVTLKEPALKFRVRTAMDVWVIKETCVDLDYVPQGLVIRPEWAVVDIGGGLGDFAVWVAQQVPAGVVHAYEPLPESGRLLTHNQGLNGIKNLTLYPVAVASEAGELVLETAETEAVSARFVAGQGEVVPAVSLETVLERLPNGRCDLLKLDCEGGEYDILLHSDPALLQRIDHMVMEFHDGFTAHSGRELADYLRAHGFDVVIEDNPVHDYLGFIFAKRAVV